MQRNRQLTFSHDEERPLRQAISVKKNASLQILRSNFFGSGQVKIPAPLSLLRFVLVCSLTILVKFTKLNLKETDKNQLFVIGAIDTLLFASHAGFCFRSLPSFWTLNICKEQENEALSLYFFLSFFLPQTRTEILIHSMFY